MEPNVATTIALLEREKARANRRYRAAFASALRQGIAQREIARQTGKSQPEVRRLATESTARDAAGASRGWTTAREATVLATRALHQGDEVWAFKAIVQARDHLRELSDPDDVAEWALTPPPIPHPGLDNLLAVLTAHEFRSRRDPTPEWATPRRLDEDWTFTALPSRAARVRAQTPQWLSRWGVYVSDRDLVTA